MTACSSYFFKSLSLDKFLKSFLPFVVIVVNSCGSAKHSSSNDSLLKTSLPRQGRLIDDKPVGKGWIDLIASLDDWNLEKQNWKLDGVVLHGDYHGGKLHSYGYTKTRYKNFEINAVIRMTGTEANSGVCIRINPTDFDNAPGYQIDMGPQSQLNLVMDTPFTGTLLFDFSNSSK